MASKPGVGLMATPNPASRLREPSPAPPPPPVHSTALGIGPLARRAAAAAGAQHALVNRRADRPRGGERRSAVGAADELYGPRRAAVDARLAHDLGVVGVTAAVGAVPRDVDTASLATGNRRIDRRGA